MPLVVVFLLVIMASVVLSTGSPTAPTSASFANLTTSPHAIEASHLTPPLDSEPAVLTVPTTVHTHKI